jgi:alpha-tubulin suppressor-like RCC1 family protein
MRALNGRPNGQPSVGVSRDESSGAIVNRQTGLVSMKRFLLLLGMLPAFVGCEDPSVDPFTTGSITLRVLIPPDPPSSVPATAASQAQGSQSDTAGVNESRQAGPDVERLSPGSGEPRAPTEPAGHLESIRVTVQGLTNKTQTFQCTATTCQGTVDGLSPGSYTVSVEGLVSSEVDYYGRTTGVSVQAGSNSSVTINFQTFRPTLGDFAVTSTTAMRFTVTYTGVQNADSYIIEWSKASDFSGSSSVTATGTSTAITVSDIGTYFVRVRAANATVPSGGRPSAAKSIEVTTDQTQSGDDVTTAPQLGTQWDFTGTLTMLNVFPATDQDWFKVLACTNDVLVIETRAARLTPASGLNTFLHLWDASGTAIDVNDNINGTTDSKIQKTVPADGAYYVQVTGVNNTVGHYEVSIEVQEGPKNAATKCTTTKQVVVSAVQDTLVALDDQMQLTATAYDTTGAPVSGVTFTWASSDPSVLSVDANGLVTALANGSATITATESGVQGQKALAVAQAVATVTVDPATASIAQGATQQFTAAATDANGNDVTGVKFFWASNNPAVAVVDTNGLATGMAGGTATITALGKGQPGHAQLTVGAQVATQLAFSIQPSNAVAGDAISPAIQVEIRDASNKLVTAARDAVTLAIGTNPGGGTLAGTKTVNAINGIASFTGLWINKTGTGYTLGATSGSLTGATSGAFNITPGAPAKLAFSGQPSNVQGNVVINPQVTVSINDLYDNQTSATNAVTVSLANNPWRTPFSMGGTLAGTLTVSAVAGVATFSNLRIDRPAPGYTLAASSGTLAGAASSSFNVNLTVQQVSASTAFGSHTCAVTTGGSYCWGSNGSGELGAPIGPTYNDSVAALVRGGLTFVQVTAGAYHSCGITAAGAAYCWGYNYYGQLGNGATVPGGADSGVPVAVTGNHVFTQIEAGYLHTCGVTTASGTAAEDRQVYCWGYNAQGQLGNGVGLPGAPQSTPQRVVEPLRTTTRATSVATGSYHTCARTEASTLYCWGYNNSGQLGDGLVIPGVNSSTPVLVVGGFTNWTSVTAGFLHSCGRRDTGELRCWGNNYYGQLGNAAAIPNAPSQSSPVLVDGTSGGNPLNFASVSAGQYHTCGVTGGTNPGLGYCWGYNGDGELGDDTQDNISQPKAVVGSLTFVALDAGSSHSCARTNTAVYCWGAGYSGELGNGATGSFRKVPVQIVQ